MPTFEQYRAMLPVHKHRLDDELEIQAQLMEQISTETVKQNARMLERKLDLDKLEGRLMAELKEDEPKLTAAEVTAKIKRDPDRVKQWEIYLAALSEHLKWEGLRDAWRQKGFSIKTLADLYAAQYFQLSSHQARQRTERGNDPEAQDAERARLRIAGRSAIPTAEEFAQHVKASQEPVRSRRRAVND